MDRRPWEGPSRPGALGPRDLNRSPNRHCGPVAAISAGSSDGNVWVAAVPAGVGESFRLPCTPTEGLRDSAPHPLTASSAAWRGRAQAPQARALVWNTPPTACVAGTGFGPPSLSVHRRNTGVTGAQGGDSRPAAASRPPPPAQPVWGRTGALGRHRDWGATALEPGEAPQPAASWLLLGPKAQSGACPHEEPPLWTHSEEMAREGDGARGRLRVLVQAGLAPPRSPANESA